MEQVPFFPFDMSTGTLSFFFNVQLLKRPLLCRFSILKGISSDRYTCFVKKRTNVTTSILQPSNIMPNKFVSVFFLLRYLLSKGPSTIFQNQKMFQVHFMDMERFLFICTDYKCCPVSWIFCFL